MTERVPYEKRRNAALPWGYWCRTSGEEWPPLFDEEGNEWHSVREYFWTARLGMARASEHDRQKALEVLLSVLVAIDRRVIGIEERVIDLFEDSWQLARQFLAPWLEGLGLTQDGLSNTLTPEGRAVLVMLASTRSRQAAPIPIGPPEGNNLPLARTLWSIDFPHGYERDRLYRWLVDRIDRWESWAERARLHGAQALTEHLLRLRFADEPLESG